MKALALLSLLLSSLAAALVAPRQAVAAAAVEVIAVSVIGGEDFTIFPTPTSAPLAIAADIAAPSQTITHHAKIIQQKAHPEPIYIFPFHVQLTQSCSSRSISGFWINGDYTSSFSLNSGASLSVNHFITGYPNFQLGPFDEGKGVMRFRYENTVFYEDGEQNVCKWHDGEMWRECGECRAGLWDRNCAGDGGGERVSHIQRGKRVINADTDY
jgi:hypothetical protein